MPARVRVGVASYCLIVLLWWAVGTRYPSSEGRNVSVRLSAKLPATRIRDTMAAADSKLVPWFDGSPASNRLHRRMAPATLQRPTTAESGVLSADGDRSCYAHPQLKNLSFCARPKERSPALGPGPFIKHDGRRSNYELLAPLASPSGPARRPGLTHFYTTPPHQHRTTPQHVQQTAAGSAGAPAVLYGL